LRGNLYIVSAPSGSGKTTLLQQLIRNFEDLTFSVSHTTRSPRGSEQHGVEYFFVDRNEFLRMAERDEFLEHAEYHGNLYGTSRAFVETNLSNGRDVILDIDVQGANQVKARCNGAVSLFLLPPSFGELERRLRTRRLEDDETIRKRLAIAKREILRCRDYDYIVVNDQIQESVRELESIVTSGSDRVNNENDEDSRIDEIIASFGGTD
jgi:guanylate kinase